MSLGPVNILFLPAVFFIGFITSQEDLRTSKIRNKWILGGFIYGLAVFFGLIIWNFIADPVSQFFYTSIVHIGPNDPRPIFRVHWDFFWKSGLNSFSALILGFILWKNSVMSAGDAKLFFVYAFLIPVTHYWKAYLPVFPALALLINVFVIILIYFFISACFYSVYRFTRSSESGLGKKIFDRARGLFSKGEKSRNYGEQIKLLGGFMSLFLIFYFLSDLAKRYLFFDISAAGQAFFILLIVFSRQVMKTLFKNRKIFKIILFFGLLFCGYGLVSDFWPTSEMVLKTIRTMILFMITMTVVSKTIDNYIEGTAKIIIPVSSLKPRMVLDKDFLKRLTTDDSLAGEQIKEVLPGGLNEAQAGFIRLWAEKRGIKSVTVCRKFSFAVWLFLAVLVTLVIKGSLVNFILDFFKVAA